MIIVRIFLPRSKTDIYREGNYVYIRASSSKYCPVGVLRRYLNLSGIYNNSTLSLFRPHSSNSSYTLRCGKISYTRCREILRDFLSKLGYKIRNSESQVIVLPIQRVKTILNIHKS